MIHLVHKSGKKELLGRNVEEQVRLATVVGIFKDFYKQFMNLIYGMVPTDKPYE